MRCRPRRPRIGANARLLRRQRARRPRTGTGAREIPAAGRSHLAGLPPDTSPVAESARLHRFHGRAISLGWVERERNPPMICLHVDGVLLHGPYRANSATMTARSGGQRKLHRLPNVLCSNILIIVPVNIAGSRHLSPSDGGVPLLP